MVIYQIEKRHDTTMTEMETKLTNLTYQIKIKGRRHDTTISFDISDADINNETAVILPLEISFYYQNVDITHYFKDQDTYEIITEDYEKTTIRVHLYHQINLTLDRLNNFLDQLEIKRASVTFFKNPYLVYRKI